MRFIPDGPDIPNDLLKKWRNGDVIFLAGAGVSVPSKLPLFEGLALAVYKELGDPLFDILKRATRCSRPASRTKILQAAAISPERRVEAELFLSKQFDRLFSALEKRVDPDLKGRAKTRKVRNAIESILGGRTYSDSHRDLLRLSLSSATSGDPSEPPLCRIATTNFDLLFEEAWIDEFGAGSATGPDARMAPRPGSHNFKGVIHLHGLLSADPKRPAEYILSSRDFARVYLRSGVIGNYVYDLIRRYTVVLVGYSADDPPMRYLMDAIGEDASLFDDMNRPYAITDQRSDPNDPNGAIAEAAWRSKEVEPIFFRRRAGSSPFAPLWETLHLWADWAREDATWVQRQLEDKASTRHEEATPFQRSFMQDLLSLLDVDELERAISFLRDRHVDFGWIDTIATAIEAAGVSPDRSRAP